MKITIDLTFKNVKKLFSRYFGQLCPDKKVFLDLELSGKGTLCFKFEDDNVDGGESFLVRGCRLLFA
jgi:hypothetical protein